MELDELRHVVDDFVRVSQCGQAVTCHARADDLVMMEGDALRPEATRAGLADVVHERGEPQLVTR